MRFLRENGLSVTLFALFLVFWIGQALCGWRHEVDQQLEHGEPPAALSEYLASGSFWESTTENWESEFLQMAAFVILTVFLKQKGSPESKPPGGDPALDRPPRPRPGAPWPVRRGGAVLRVYERSLSLALAGLFLFSFALHAVTGASAFNEEQARHGAAAVSALGYAATSRFWFESFQNWQSEFLSVGTLVVLGIWLRQRGSPESKPVDAPHAENEACAAPPRAAVASPGVDGHPQRGVLCSFPACREAPGGPMATNDEGRRLRRGRLPRLVAVAVGLAAALPVRPATLSVDSPADESSSSAPNGTCTLREAVIAASLDAAVDGCAAGAGADVIVLPAGTYTLTLAGAGEDAAQTGDLDLGSVSIQGAGAATTVIRGGGDRVLHVLAGATATITGVTVEQGSASFGGGIYVDGTLTLADAVVRANVAATGGGLFISSFGTVQIDRSTLSDNVADGPGGGAIFNAGVLGLTNATVSRNAATSFVTNGGGGIANGIQGFLLLTSVTFAGNTAAAPSTGNGIANAGTISLLRDTLLGDPGPSCAGNGTFTSAGHNLEAGGDTCGLVAAGDLPGASISLGALQDNGGGTPTHALAPGAPAVDAGSGSCPAEDQRGASRPQDGDGDGVAACDIGAFELEGQPPRADLGVTLFASPDPVRGGEPCGWFVTVGNAGPAAATGVVATIALPAEVTLTSTSPTQGSCSGTGPVTCSVGTVASGAEARIALSARAPPSVGVLQASASVASGVADPNPANDAATASLTVDAPYPAVIVSPASASVSPGGQVTFTASGGSGTGWTWWLATNASGASLHPQTGAYTAGQTGGVQDVVQVNDSLGHLASATVSVSAPDGDGGGCGCGARTGAASVLGMGILLLLRRPRRVARGAG